ncbi:hypothetical protein [Bacillus subtilis]|uniref:hypothetical protein n=1 Tax=Bacillus subtilis TaxID=1423 RepID=UPI00331538AC
MNPDKFMNSPIIEKLNLVNKMLEKEEKDHLKNVSEKIGIPYSAFIKIMRDNGNFQYNQTTKKYEKLMGLEEYEKYLQFEDNTEEKADEALKFLKEHLEDLKKLLEIHHNQLILDPKYIN